jgi:hypothetical protein
MPPAVFEPAIPASKMLQAHALDRTTNGFCGVNKSVPYLESALGDRTLIRPPCLQDMMNPCRRFLDVAQVKG